MIRPGHIPFEEALTRAQRYCAKEEKCRFQVRHKLLEWGTDHDTAEQILEHLIRDNYINQERFAREYAVGKFRNNKWGRFKIANELMRLHISNDVIEKALQEIDPSDYEALLNKLLMARYHSLKGTEDRTASQKIATFAIGKGFEPELVWKTVKALMAGS